MAKNISFIAERLNADETTIILFNCRVSSQLIDATAVKNTIAAAVRRWGKESPESKAPLEYTGGDFNFGDLAVADISNGTDLCVILENAGIFDIEAQIISGESSFSLDTNLNDDPNALSEVDLLHEEVREWIQEQGLPVLSLDEIPLADFSESQMKQRDAFMKRFENL